MPIVKSSGRASRNHEASASNTPKSNRDHESPVTSSHAKKPGWRQSVWKTFNKVISKDLDISPSPTGGKHSRKPIPEFFPKGSKESGITKIHYEHSNSKEYSEIQCERPGTASPWKSGDKRTRSKYSSEKPSRRKSMGDIFGTFSRLRNTYRHGHDICERDLENRTGDIPQTPPEKRNARTISKFGDNLNYGSDDLSYYSSSNEAPSFTVHHPTPEIDASEERQPTKEDRARTPDSYLELLIRAAESPNFRRARTPDFYLDLLIRAAESPNIRSNDYDDLFATPCRSDSRQIHSADCTHSTTATKPSAVDQKNTNRLLSVEVGKVTPGAALGIIGPEFRRRLEDREERYLKLTTQPDVKETVTPIIQSVFPDCQEANTLLVTDRSHNNKETIEKVVAIMTKHRHSSSPAQSDLGSSDAADISLRPLDALTLVRDFAAIQEVRRLGKPIRENTIKEKSTTVLVKKLKEIRSAEHIQRLHKFINRTAIESIESILEDSIGLRTPSELRSYLPIISLPYRTKWPLEEGKIKTDRAHKKVRKIGRAPQVSPTFVEFPQEKDEPTQLRRYNSQSDAMAALYEACQKCEYSEHFIWDPNFRVYKALPHHSPVPDEQEMKENGCQLMYMPMHGEAYNRASILHGLNLVHADEKVCAKDDSLPSSDILKAESLSLEPYESSYDAETAFLKIPFQRLEKRNSNLNFISCSKIADETDSKVLEDYLCKQEINSSTGERFWGNDFAQETDSNIMEDFIFENEIDSSIGRSYLGSDYSASHLAMCNPERLRIFRELMGSEIHDPSSEPEVSTTKTWFDLAKEYKARHLAQKSRAHSEPVSKNSEFYSDDGRYEGDFVEEGSEISSAVCEKAKKEVGCENSVCEDQDLNKSACDAAQMSRSSSVCSRPTFRHIENIAPGEKTRPLAVVTEVIPSEGESSGDQNPSVVLDLDDVDEAYTPQMIQDMILSTLRKHMCKKVRNGAGLQDTGTEVDSSKDGSSILNDADQSDCSIVEFSPGFKFSNFGGVLKDIGEPVTPTKTSRDTRSLNPGPPHIGHGSPPGNKAVTSCGSTKGKMPLRLEYTPIFDDIEPFHKVDGATHRRTPITLDDLNVKVIGKAARHCQPTGPEGRKVGALVDVFQAHGLMPRRLRPELIRVPSPVNCQHPSGGRPPTPMPRTPSKAKSRPQETDCEAFVGTQVFLVAAERAAGPSYRLERYSGLSDAETELSSVFGFELERTEPELPDRKQRAYRDSELYG